MCRIPPRYTLIIIVLLVVILQIEGFSQRIIEGKSASPKELAAAMRPRPSSGFFLRMKIDSSGGGQARSNLQVQVKGRRIGEVTDLLYQIQFPKKRQGEGVLIRWKNGSFVTGYNYIPGAAPKPLTIKNLFEPIFGSALSYHDTSLAFWEWSTQSDIGREIIMGADCQVIDSEPIQKRTAGYERIRSWIDIEKKVPMRIEKFAAKRLSLVIETKEVAKADEGRFFARRYSLVRPGVNSGTTITVTNLESKEYLDNQFTPDKMREITPK